MRNVFFLSVCLFSLINAKSVAAGHTARAATASSAGGVVEIDTINKIPPDSSHNFTINAGTGVIITPGTNSVTIAAPGGMSGVGAIQADAGGFITGSSVTVSGGSTGLTTDAIGSTQIDLTGVLHLSNGGTNANLTASEGGIFYSTSTEGAILSGTSTANQVLLSGSSSAPSWSTATYPSTTTANELLYSASADTIGQITTADNAVLITSNTGAPSWLANSSTVGYVLTANSGAPPSWQPGAGGYMTTVTAGGTTTLTVESTAQQYFTGTTTQTVVLPVTSTLTLGQVFKIVNNSTGLVRVEASGGGADTIQSMASNTTLLVTVLSTAGAGTTSEWSAFYAPNVPQGISEFVVDGGYYGGYTTIQSAINAAAAVATSTNPQTVWIWPGTYTENVTLVDYVSLNASNAAATNIVGAATGILSAEFSATGITFTGNVTTAASGFLVPAIVFNSCVFNASSNAAFKIVNVDSYANYIMNNCIFSGTSGLAAIVVNSDVSVNWNAFGCVINGSSNTDSILAGGGSYKFVSCVINDTFHVQQNGTPSFFSCVFNPVQQIEAIVLADEATATLINCYIDTPFDNWASGSGEIQYSNITLANGNINAASQISGYEAQVSNLSFDGGNSFFNPLTQGTEYQVLLGTGTSALSVVSGTGTSGQLLMSNGSGNNPTWNSFPVLTEGVSEFVVDKQGNAGYTNISAAVTAAQSVATSTTPQTVWIWPGTYIEDVSITGYVNLAAAAPGSVEVQGQFTYTPATSNQFIALTGIIFSATTGTSTVEIDASNTCVVTILNCTISGINGPNLLYLTGSSSCTLNLTNCTIEGYASNNIEIDNTGSSTVNLTNVNNIGLTFCPCFLLTGNATVNAYNYSSQFTNVGSTVAGSTALNFYSSNVQDFFNLSGSAVLSAYNSTLSNGSFGNTMITIGSGCSANVYDCFYTGDANWVANEGGTLNYGSVTSSQPGDSSGTSIELQSGSISFDAGTSSLNTLTQGIVNQVLLGTGTSAVSVVSGTGTAGQVLTSNGTGSNPTWQNSGSVLAITPVSTNYDVLLTDYFIQCTAGGITVTLPGTSVPTGQSFVIKDSGGNALASPITITPAGGMLIDGSASYQLNHNYQSASVLYDGAAYEIFSAYAGS